MKNLKIVVIIFIYVFTYLSFFWFIPQFLNGIFGAEKNNAIFLFQLSCAIGIFAGHYIAGVICNLLFKRKKLSKLYIKK